MFPKSLFSGWWLAALAVIVLAVLIRFWGLGEIPHGMAWDEAAIGYNGYAVITTRRDEYLVRFPVSFQSFGDYKAPLAIYLNGIGTFLFGMHLSVVRLPFAVASIFAIIGMMLLVYELSVPLKKERWWAEAWSVQKALTLVSGLIMTFSIWHFHYSRIAFESGMALMWLLLSAGSMMRALRLNADPKSLKSKLSWLWAISSVVFACASLYTYHSAKIVTPLILGALAVWQWRALRARLVLWTVMTILGLGLLFPLIKDSVWGTGNERWQQASLFGREGTMTQKVTQFASQWALHFSPSFLVGGYTDSLRHGNGTHGVLSVLEFFFVITAVVMAGVRLTKRTESRTEHSMVANVMTGLGLWWVAVGIVPAALGVDVPHSNRALLALPGYILLATAGLQTIIEWVKTNPLFAKVRGTHQEKEILVKSVVGTTFLFLVMSFLPYYHSYMTKYAADSTDAYMDGYLEAFEWVIPYEKGTEGKKKVDQIIFTTDYGQAYIYALFARRTNPIWYKGGSLNTYLFTDKVAESDMLRPNTIVVASATDPGAVDTADHVVYGKDGSVRFKIYLNQE